MHRAVKTTKEAKPKANPKLTNSQQVGFKFMVEQERAAQFATHKFLRECFTELGLDPKKNYTVTDSFELVETK